MVEVAVRHPELGAQVAWPIFDNLLLCRCVQPFDDIVTCIVHMGKTKLQGGNCKQANKETNPS